MSFFKGIFGYTTLFVVLLIMFVSTVFGQVRLPKLISDGMVLQRDTELKIWGWASEGEQISISFIDSVYNTSANSSGDWYIKLPELDAGGPYDMTINGSNAIIIHDIMIGEVWICSGQSNMEITMQRVSPLYEAEIAGCENPYIRYFEVPDKYNFHEPQKDFQCGQWEKTNPENILRFSAVCYFFGKDIDEKYNVPVGLINAALGGSPVESWISEESLKKFPEHYNEAQRFKDDSLIQEIQKSDRARSDKWYSELRVKDEGYIDHYKLWYSPEHNSSNWKTMNVPGNWPKNNSKYVNGVYWFRKDFEIPESMVGKELKLLLGRIVDADSVFVNGTFVGTTGYQYPPRRYKIPAGVLAKGKNNITVRVISNIGQGGFVEDKPYEIISNNDKVDLKGEWQYKLGAEMQPLESQTFIRWKPVGLYNAMIAPMLNYSMRGVIWYQGESNAERPADYRKLFTTLINDWRKNWNYEILPEQKANFPFLFVQLPNFMEAKSEPSESNWALIREAQLQTLSLPNTAMVVAIDIGEWNDIHPLNKKDVGNRLFLAAQKVAYGIDNIDYSGPIYKSMSIEGNKIILSFDNVDGGLCTKSDEDLKEFSIAGADKHFVWAYAVIKDNKIVVWSDDIPNPVAVRYAWADNPPKANLYNRGGLPASPFRTDDFK